MYCRRKRSIDINEILIKEPNALSIISGGENYSEINGKVSFYQTSFGVLVFAEIHNLPIGKGKCGNDIFAFHIHNGGSCTGNTDDEFSNAGTHFNSDGCPHPYHAGDMPPLFTAGKIAFLAFLTDRFTVSEIVGKTVIIHSRPDDFSTQPSGNSGEKIACGEIKWL